MTVRPPPEPPRPWLAHYPAGVPADLDVPSGPLWSFIRDGAARAPARTALVAGDRRISFGELWAEVRAEAERLGPGRGTVVLSRENDPEFVTEYHGALLAGRTVAALHPGLTPPERAEAEAALAGEAPADVAVLQLTSGTTGFVKAAMMSHGNLVANALQNNLWFGWSEADVVLGALPFCHTWGMCCALNAPLAAGASVVRLPRFDADLALAAIARERVTVIYGSATMFTRLLDAAGAGAARVFASVRYVKAGAMLVGDGLPERFARAVPDVPMILGYGLTEASPEVTDNPPDRPKPGSVGVPLPGTHVRIADPEDPERILGAGAVGEVQVRGPQVTRGYLGRRSETARVLLPGGWLRTGDLGEMDAEGYLRIVDRLKDLIKFRGWSVVPAEVERALLTHPDVAEAAVVGVPDPVDGEVPVAFVRPAPGSAPAPAGLAAHLEGRLAEHKRPRRIVLVDEIPKNAVGKPLRRLLRGGA